MTRKAALRARTTLQLLADQCGIYRLTIGGKIYVGATRNFARREQEHLRALFDGMHHSYLAQRAFERADRPTDLRFEILERCQIKDLGEREDAHIQRLNSVDPAVGLNVEKASRLKPGARPVRGSRGQADPDITPVTLPVGTPRASQQRALDAILAHCASGGSRAFVEMPCGTGKTRLAAFLKAHTGRMLFITHTKELVDQTLGTFMDVWPGHDVGIIKQQEFNPNHQIVVASALTLARRLEVLDPAHFDVIICDEAHLFGADTGTLICAHFKPRLLLGMSATPERRTGTTLDTLFEKVVFRLKVTEAIEEKILCPVKLLSFETEFKEEDLVSERGDFTNSAALLDRAPINRLVAQNIHKHAGNRRTLVFATNKKHAGHLTHALLALGMEAAVVHEGDPQRNAKIQAFRTGKLQVLVNVNIASYGFDVPQAEVCVLVYATSSNVRFTQNVGRVMRAAEGKTHGTVLDFGGNYTRGMRVGNDYEFEVDELPLAENDRRRSKVSAAPDITTDGQESGAVVAMHSREHDDVVTPLWQEWGSRANHEQHSLLRQLGIRAPMTLSGRAAAEQIASAPAKPWQIERLRAMGIAATTEWTFVYAREALQQARYATTPERAAFLN